MSFHDITYHTPSHVNLNASKSHSREYRFSDAHEPRAYIEMGYLVPMMLWLSFVVWRVHLERMSRRKNAAGREIEEDGVEVEVEEVPPGRTCFSRPQELEKLDISFLDSVDEPLHFEKAIPSPPSPHPHPPSPSPPPPPPYFQPNPALYPKCAPRFYSVVWTGGHNIGINGEYLLPDLDYPGRVLLSESTFQAWRKQNLHAWQNNQ